MPTTMPTTATHPHAETLLLALDLGNTTWKLGFSTGPAQAPRMRTMMARDLEVLAAEIDGAKRRFVLPSDSPVVSCYEAGRDGFWVHRALTHLGVVNFVVDSSSIEGNRRGRQPKSDSLDTRALLSKLARHAGGERGVWSVVHVPSVEDEDRRQLHRELSILTASRTRTINRIKSLLALHGIVLAGRGLPRTLPPVAERHTWDNSPLPGETEARLVREWARLTNLRREIRMLVTERRARLRKNDPADPTLRMVRSLLALKGIGEVSAWIYTTEFFAWRQFRNRRQVGGAAGLCSTRRESGDVAREQGISKSGNQFMRSLAIELAWSWLRRQPQSALSQWYRRRFAAGGARMRRIGIVALARKLLVALWRYLETGALPEGALLKA